MYKSINKALFIFLIGAAILAVSCSNPGSERSLITPTRSDKDDLSEIIEQSETLLGELAVSDDGSDVNQDNNWVESGLKWRLECAIETANTVFSNPNANTEDIQAALEELTRVYNEVNTAKKPGKIGRTDFSRLSGLITNAENLLSELNGYEVSEDGKKVYTDTYWVTAAQKQALASAISEAKEVQSVAANNLSTQDTVDEAYNTLYAVYNTAANAKRLGTFVANKSALLAKIAEAKKKIDGIYPSANGNDIPKYEYWVTPVIYNNLQTAITTADALINNPHARQPAIDAAVKALENAITAFNPQAGNKPFDVSQLNDLITSAQELLAELKGLQVSVDGTDVYEDDEWISAAVKQTLAGAISTAQNSADNPLIKPDEAEKALDALSAVYHTARSAKKFGTFIADKTELQAAIASAEAKMAGVLISNDGYDILTSQKWVTHTEMSALAAALGTAIEKNAEPYARQEAVNAVEQNLAAAIAAFTPKEGLLIHGWVNITFAGPGNETITLTGDKALSWEGNNTLTVTVTETFDSYQWYVDGVIKAGETGRSISLNARSFSAGAHTLTLKVTKGGVPYTKALTFTVN